MFSIDFGLTRLGNQRSPNISAPWNPTDISAIAWYDVSDVSTLFQDTLQTVPVVADGDPVALVLDKSGHSNHLEQSSSAARPIYRNNGTSQWLALDGSTQFLKCTGLTVPSTLSFVIGATVTTIPSTFASLLSMAGSAGFQIDGGSQSSGFNFRFNGTDVSARRPQSTSEFQEAFHAYSILLNASEGLLEGRVDAERAYSTTTYNGALPVNQTLRIFANSAENQKVGGKFFRFALWGTTATADVDAAEAWALMAE